MKQNKSKKSKYGVFIIESLRSDDFFDGHNLYEILLLSEIPAKYEEALSVTHFKELINKFASSGYRYLHLSCHGNSDSIEINGDTVTNEELQLIFKKKLNNKRLFMSACEGANKNLAIQAISNCKAYSLIGTPVGFYFDKSALFWPAFYHVMNEVDSKKMRREAIKKILKQCTELFNVPIDYYSRMDEGKRKIRRLRIRKDSPTINHMFSV